VRGLKRSTCGSIAQVAWFGWVCIHYKGWASWGGIEVVLRGGFWWLTDWLTVSVNSMKCSPYSLGNN
jgi:hypothetical protein